MLGLAALTIVGPLYLFWDPLSLYWLRNDDFAYLGASRNLERTRSALFRPHNVHIAPCWASVLNLIAAAAAGKLASVGAVLPWLTFLGLGLAIVLVGLIVSRETRSATAALAAMAFSGTTSILQVPATWYSAGQSLWAGIGVLMALRSAQSWRRSGGAWRLASSAVWAAVAGGFWTAGHVAGPAAAAYLAADGRKAARRAALVPLMASIAAVVTSYAIGAAEIRLDPRFSPPREASRASLLLGGVSHTLQAIPETLVLGNLGLTTSTSVPQAATFCLAMLWAWGWTIRRFGKPSSLELAGFAMIVGGYLACWTFRGYLAYALMRGQLDWYNSIPHLGAVLFVAGGWARISRAAASPARLSWAGALGIVALEVGLVVVHQPHSDEMFVRIVPPVPAEERRGYPTLALRRLRAAYLGRRISEWQRRHLARLDQAEVAARRHGIGLGLIRSAFGRLDAPDMPDTFDAADLLDTPETGRETDPAVARRVLAPYFRVEPRPEMPSLDEISRRSTLR